MAVAPITVRPSPVTPTTPVRRPSDLSPFAARMAMFAITLCAAALRLLDSAGPPFRLDEGFTVRMAALPLHPVMQGRSIYLHSLFQTVAADVHPPGYLLLMHVWIHAFGAGLAVLRLPSELAGIAAVVAVYALGRSLYSRLVGVIAALLAAVSPFWIWHAQEARMYSFLVLFTVLGTYGLVLAVEHRHRAGWPLFLIATILAIYTQYYAFLIIAAQGIWLLLQWRRVGLGSVLFFALALGIAAVSYGPWLLQLRGYYHGASDPNLTPANLYTPLVMLSDFLFGYLSVPYTSSVVAAWPLLVPLTLAVGTWGRRMSERGLLLWLLFLVPIGTALLVTYTVRPVLSERYLIVSLPALYILVGVVAAEIRSQRARVVLLGLILLASLVGWRIEEVSAANPETQDYRAPVRYIEQHIRPGDVIALDAYYNQDAYSYYSHLNAPVYDLPPAGTSRPTPATLAPYLRAIGAGARRLWVIYYLETNGDPHNVVRHFLAYHTAGHTVIYGGPYRRNDPHFPDSYRSVQLVVYRLIPTRAGAAQLRPETEQEQRALTHISPTVRAPLAPVFDAPGAHAGLVGTLLSVPQPRAAWQLPGVDRPTARDVHLIVFNPYPAAARLTIRSTGRTLSIVAPPTSNLDLTLDRWGGLGAHAALTVRSTLPITVLRTVVTRGQEELTYARPLGMGLSRTAATP